MIYHQHWSLLPKHTQPNRWWGFCLYLHTMINYNIYIMYLFNVTGVKTGALQSPSPWDNIVLDVPIHKNTYAICTSKIKKNCRSVPHSIIYLNFQDQAPWLPWASPAGSQLSSHPQIEELCGYFPLYVPSWGSLDVNDVLHISNIWLDALSLLAEFPLSLHAWNVS